VGQEYFINSEELESKVRSLLPSQGGAGAGFDLSASTQIIPIIDLTESAEGSNLRQDLQTSLNFTQATAFSNNSDATILSNTGYWRVIGTGQLFTNPAAAQFIRFQINDGASDKTIWASESYIGISGTFGPARPEFDFICKLEAGHSLKVDISDTFNGLSGSFRQIASIDGTLS
jgi:hypothetical protein